MIFVSVFKAWVDPKSYCKVEVVYVFIKNDKICQKETSWKIRCYGPRYIANCFPRPNENLVKYSIQFPSKNTLSWCYKWKVSRNTTLQRIDAIFRQRYQRFPAFSYSSSIFKLKNKTCWLTICYLKKRV